MRTVFHYYITEITKYIYCTDINQILIKEYLTLKSRTGNTPILRENF